jgi:hypothetical protein
VLFGPQKTLPPTPFMGIFAQPLEKV